MLEYGIIWCVVTFVIGCVAGFYACAYLVAKDKNWVKIREGEVVVPEPEAGNILVSVPPTVARRLVAANANEDYGLTPEARNLYSDRKLTGLVKR